MILGIGVDLVDAGRIRRKVAREGEAFLLEFLTSEEIDACRARRDPAPCHAARFAAKEAFTKALGTGLTQGLAWRDIAVRNEAGGRPALHLTGAAERAGRELGMKKVHLSLSHEGDFAVAVVVLEG